eukprot:4196756-Alexandrium_andersonii.AAC.1
MRSPTCPLAERAGCARGYGPRRSCSGATRSLVERLEPVRPGRRGHPDARPRSELDARGDSVPAIVAREQPGRSRSDLNRRTPGDVVSRMSARGAGWMSAGTRSPPELPRSSS